MDSCQSPDVQVIEEPTIIQPEPAKKETAQPKKQEEPEKIEPTKDKPKDDDQKQEESLTPPLLPNMKPILGSGDKKNEKDGKSKVTSGWDMFSEQDLFKMNSVSAFYFILLSYLEFFFLVTKYYYDERIRC